MINLGSSVFHLSGRTLTVLGLIHSQASSAHFRLDLLLSDADRNFVLCYLRGVVLCLQKHITVSLTSVELDMGGVTAVTSYRVFCLSHRITADQRKFTKIYTANKDHLHLVMGTTRIWQHGETSSGGLHVTVTHDNNINMHMSCLQLFIAAYLRQAIRLNQ